MTNRVWEPPVLNIPPFLLKDRVDAYRNTSPKDSSGGTAANYVLVARDVPSAVTNFSTVDQEEYDRYSQEAQYFVQTNIDLGLTRGDRIDWIDPLKVPHRLVVRNVTDWAVIRQSFTYECVETGF